MAEYISCRNCDSAYCEGCNIYTLATMLQAGKFDCLMDENHSVNPAADVTPMVHGKWTDTGVENSTGNIYFCSVCYKFTNPNKKDAEMKRAKEKPDFCPNCGAKMDGERKGDG